MLGNVLLPSSCVASAYYVTLTRSNARVPITAFNDFVNRLTVTQEMEAVPDNLLGVGTEKREKSRVIPCVWPSCLERPLTEIGEAAKLNCL